MSIKKLDDGRYEVDVRPQGADENVSGGNLKLKVKLKHSNVMYWLTTTTKSGWRNQPTAELLQSC